MVDPVTQSIEEIFAPYEPLLTVKESAELLRVDPQTIRTLCGQGELPSRKINGRWLVVRDLLKKQIIDGVPTGDEE